MDSGATLITEHAWGCQDKFLLKYSLSDFEKMLKSLITHVHSLFFPSYVDDD